MEKEPDPEYEVYGPSAAAPDASIPPRARTRGTVALCAGALSIVVGAWLAANGIGSLAAPILGVWQLLWSGWSGLSGASPDPRAVLLMFAATFLWFAGAAATSLLGWAMVLRGVDLIWRPRSARR